ncbi:hypothetical protein DVT68_09610 [Dyella solisilvae]|uniref:Uncharacterized protein n=2 Tax=Dyella solisilvae TaxID=1920168 RepID=A0A370K7Y2_9GAMM|nr:hypothetical protein DVT68_09610 [Dyella solisilvae]
MIARAIRGFFNVTASGVLLLLGVGLFFGTMGVPSDSPSWKANGPGGAAVVLFLALFSAFLAYAFRKQANERRTWAASFIINVLSTVAFLSVFVMWAIHHF